MNTAIVSSSGASAGIGFAVPAETVTRVVPQLVQYGKVKRAGLGVTLLRDDFARRWGVTGVVIRSVLAGSAADRAGLRGIEADRSGNVRSFDVIVGIDDRSIANYDDLYAVLDQHDVGDVVTVRFQSGRREREVKIELQQVN